MVSADAGMTSCPFKNHGRTQQMHATRNIHADLANQVNNLDRPMNLGIL